MSKLYVLLFGRSKKNMKPIMVDTQKKCENYCLARQNVVGFHRIEEAGPGATQWRQKTATVGGNKAYSVGRVGKGPSGYISKRGFNQHT